MTPPQHEWLDHRLSARDRSILLSLEQFRLLTTRHLERLHFTDHSSPLAAARAASRALQRLADLGVITPLSRRIGGVRRGSASYVWQLAAAGETFLRASRGEARRRRYVEPGGGFVRHTLAVNDVAVALLEASRTIAGFSLATLVTEPENWRRYLRPTGETTWLKPDLHVVTVHADQDGEYEDHAFVEVDLGTEHLPRIRSKCAAYAAYAATGAYQAAHGLIPAVVWLSPDAARRGALLATVADTPGLPQGTCRVASPTEFLRQTAGRL